MNDFTEQEINDASFFARGFRDAAFIVQSEELRDVWLTFTPDLDIHFCLNEDDTSNNFNGYEAFLYHVDDRQTDTSRETKLDI